MYAGFSCAVQVTLIVILTTWAYLLFTDEKVSIDFFLFFILIDIFVLVSFMWMLVLQHRFQPPRVLTPDTVEDLRVPLVSSALHLVCVIAMDSYLILTWNDLTQNWMDVDIVLVEVAMAIYTVIAVLHFWAFQQVAKAWGRHPNYVLLPIQSTEFGS